MSDPVQRVADHTELIEITVGDCLLALAAAAAVVTIIRRSSRDRR